MKIANLPRMFGNKDSIYLILLLFKGTATLFQLLRSIHFTFSSSEIFILPFQRLQGETEVQTWVCISKRAVGHCSKVCVWGTATPLVSMVMCQSQINLLMRLAGEAKRYLGKSWEQISVPGAEVELSCETHHWRNVTEAVNRNTPGHLECSLPAPQKV